MFKLATEYLKGTKVLPYTGKGVGDLICTLASNGKTDYKIVISDSASECEKYAAQELKKYLFLTTDAEIEILTEGEKSVLGEKLISIGDTRLASRLDTKNLNLDGFKIKTEGETLLIKGERDRGTLYGVYDFLEKFLCVRFVTKKYEHLPKTETLLLNQLDIEEVPFFMSRSHHVGVMVNSSYAAKRRMVSPHAKDGEAAAKYGGNLFRDWTGDMHSFKYLVPIEEYGERHPEWFSRKTMWQPVLSNGLKDDGTIDETKEESLLKEMIKNVKKLVLSKPEARFVSLSQNDNYNFSNHPDCVRQREIFGGYSGHQIVFANAVAREVKSQLKEEGVDRELYFVVFGYHQTHVPPVNCLDDGQVVPISPLCVPRDDVYVMLAPYEISYTEPLKAEKITDFNFIYYKQVDGWAKLTKNLFMFDYDTNFTDMLSWFPNTEVIMPNLKYYEEIGVKALWSNGARGDTYYQTILYNYLLSKLYWNPHQDMESLIKEFNAVMFGEEAGFIIDILVDYIRKHFVYESKKDGYLKPAQIYSLGSLWLVSAETLSYNFITECERLLDSAKWHLQTRSKLNEKSKEQYLFNLIYVEVMIQYMKWKNYDALFDKNSKREFMLKFADNIKKLGERFYQIDADKYSVMIETIFETEGINMNVPSRWWNEKDK